MIGYRGNFSRDFEFYFSVLVLNFNFRCYYKEKLWKNNFAGHLLSSNVGLFL